MSLQVWLPLIKDANNQGLCGNNLTTSGVTFSDGGKLGGKYLSAGTITIPAAVSKTFFNNNNMSFAFWLYPIGTTSGAIMGKQSMGAGDNRMYTIFQYSTANDLHLSWQNNTETNTTFLGGSWANFFPADTWTHCCITYNGTKAIIYKNGIQYMIVNGVSNRTSFEYDYPIFGGSNRRLQDVRIYDEALSPKQIKLLSQGLVLHYPLSDPFVEWTTNLITSEDCLSSTCFNSATAKYGYGANSDMYKTITTFDGKKGTKVYMGTNGNQAYPYVYINNMYTSNGTNSPAYKTLSFDYYTNISTSISPYKLGSGSGTATYKVINDTVKTGTGTNSVVIPVKPNTWNHIEITFHGTTDADSQWGYIQNQPSHTSNTENFWFFANMQLEAKDHTTGYTKYGTTRSDKAVYDVSGYCNNGLSSGTVAVSNNTPKYNYSTVFNGTDSYIKVNSNNWMIKGCKELTVNVWAYMDDWSTWGGRRIFSCTESGGFNTEAGDSGYIRFPVCVYTSDALTNYTYIYNNKTIKLSDLSSGWHMFTFIYKTTGIDAYVDGVLHSTYSASSYGIHYNFNTNLYLGCEAATGSFSGPYFNGKESDFRIYTTALSADDILELYNTPVHLTSNGALLTSGELTEV